MPTRQAYRAGESSPAVARPMAFHIASRKRSFARRRGAVCTPRSKRRRYVKKAIYIGAEASPRRCPCRTAISFPSAAPCLMPPHETMRRARQSLMPWRGRPPGTFTHGLKIAIASVDGRGHMSRCRRSRYRFCWLQAQRPADAADDDGRDEAALISSFAGFYAAGAVHVAGLALMLSISRLTDKRGLAPTRLSRLGQARRRLPDCGLIKSLTLRSRR